MWLSAHLPKHVPKIEYADKLCTAKINSRQRVKNICVVTGFNGLMWSCRWFNYLLHRLYSVETLLRVCGFESELAVKRHVTETQSGPVPGESAKLNVLSYFSMTVAVWNSLMVSLTWWTPGAILKRPNPFPVNHMKAVRRGLEVVFECIRIWLGRSLLSLWRALSAANSWRASPCTRGPCKAEIEEWKTNEALCHFHHGDAAESKVTVQTTTHIFHVSKRFFQIF